MTDEPQGTGDPGARRGPDGGGLVDEVLDRSADMGYRMVQMATLATEDVVFSLPPAVADPRGGGTR